MKKIMNNEVVKMMFEDSSGKLLMAEEIDDLADWEIEERGIHVASEYI